MPKTRSSKKPRDEESENITAKKPRLLSERTVNTVVISTVPDDDLKPAAVPSPDTLPPAMVVNATPVKRMVSHLRDLPVQIRLNIYECLKLGTYGLRQSQIADSWCRGSIDYDILHLHSSYLRMWAMASTFGDLEALQYIQEVFLRDQPELWPKMCSISGHFSDLLYGGHVHCLKYIRILGTSWPLYSKFFSVAIQGFPNLDTLKYLHADGCQFDDTTLAYAIKRGDIQIVRWLVSSNCPRTNEDFKEALKKDDIDLLKCIYEKFSCTWDNDTMALALKYENCAIISWLVDELEYPLTEKVFRLAAEYGNIEIMKFLLERACPWDHWTFTVAIMNHGGNQDLMEWLHDKKCPWNALTFRAAITNNVGNCDLLKWLKEHSCPWDKNIFKAAKSWKNKKIMKWLNQEACPK